MKEISSLVFINHEPGSGRSVYILVLYDTTNQKIPYDIAYYCIVLVLRVPVSIPQGERRKGRPIKTDRFAKTLSTKQEKI